MRQRAHLQPALRKGGALKEVARDPHGRVIGVLRARPPLRAQALQKTNPKIHWKTWPAGSAFRILPDPELSGP